MTSLERKIHFFPEAVVLGSKLKEYEVLRSTGIEELYVQILIQGVSCLAWCAPLLCSAI